MERVLPVTDWRELREGDVIFVEGKVRTVVDIEFLWVDGDEDPYVIKVDDVEGLSGHAEFCDEEGIWFDTHEHKWEFIKPSDLY